MTDKIKTLKDMRDLTIDDEYIFMESELRQEAIKWIKEDIYSMEEVLKIRLNMRDMWMIKRVIGKIFNLTEEDLK